MAFFVGVPKDLPKFLLESLVRLEDSRRELVVFIRWFEKEVSLSRLKLV